MNKEAEALKAKTIMVDWKNSVENCSVLFNVPESLIYAVIYKESGGKEKALGSTGDYGLMQITQPALTDFNINTGHTFNLQDMLEANHNIMVGTWYLHWLHTAFNLSWYDTLRAYNAGIGKIKQDTDASKFYALEVLELQKKFQEVMV